MTERVEYEGARLFPLLVGDFRMIAQRLHQDYPDEIIRNAQVYEACMEEFSARGWLVRYDTEDSLPDWMSDDGNRS